MFLLHLCNGMDENAVGMCSERNFAPFDASFADDAPLLPSGFRIIPIDPMKDGSSPNCTLDLAFALEAHVLAGWSGTQPLGAPEAHVLARWISRSYSCDLGVELLKSRGEGSE